MITCLRQTESHHRCRLFLNERCTNIRRSDCFYFLTSMVLVCLCFQVPGQRYVYCYKENVLESMACFRPGSMTPSPRPEQSRILWGDIIIRKAANPGDHADADMEQCAAEDDLERPGNCTTPSTPYECLSEDEGHRASPRSLERPVTPCSPDNACMDRVPSHIRRHSSCTARSVPEGTEVRDHTYWLCACILLHVWLQCRATYTLELRKNMAVFLAVAHLIYVLNIFLEKSGPDDT